ncbi:MAG: rod shape-determining protein RodA [Bacteroidota bacterium]
MEGAAGRRSINVDTLTLGLYLLLLVMGWLTVYTVSSANGNEGIFDLNKEHGKQLLWMGISLVAGFIILAFDFRLFNTLAYVAYLSSISLLIITLFVGEEINGATAWLKIGGQQFQPAEYAKIATALAIARYMSEQGFSMSNLNQVFIAIGIVILPAIIVILQNDTGSALVFGSFIFVFLREGMSPLLPLIGLYCFTIVISTLYLTTILKISILYIIGGIVLVAVIALVIVLLTSARKRMTQSIIIILAATICSVGLSLGSKTLFDKLAIHQQTRIKVWFNPKEDPYGSGYNVIQSKIAIGSGGIYGKGFRNGNYTKYRFVPKQETDFIYCTVGEEFGWIGSSIVIITFFGLLARLQFMSENGKMSFSRIYGYACLSILFFHVLVNVGMTIGFIPVIGIPLPFFSYGGSAILSFTVLLFIMINLYAHRGSVLSRSL